MMTTLNRKTATKLLLIQWARFQNEWIRLEGSTLLTGVNGSGKSTILDAITYLLTGNTKFNQAAKDRDRTVRGYVRGDTKSNGSTRYLRGGQVVSYIAMEFSAPTEQEKLVIGVCIESPDEVSQTSSHWFVCRNASIEDINFAHVEGKNLYVTPKSLLQIAGRRIKTAEFMGKERGIEQVTRALGLRCNPAKYRSKLVKMMAFNPENNIDQFIADCVLEPGTINSLKDLREQRTQFERIQKLYLDLKDGKAKLEDVEKRIQEYEAKKKCLEVREMMQYYQEMLEAKQEKEDIQIRLTALKQKCDALERRQKDVKKRCEEARKRLQVAESNDIYSGMNSSIQVLETQISELNYAIEREREQTAKLLRFQMELSGDLSWLLDNWEEQNKQYLLHLAENGYSVEKKRNELILFLKKTEQLQSEVGEQVYILNAKRRELKEEIARLEAQMKRLESSQRIYPEEVLEAKRLIEKEFERRGICTDVRFLAELVQSIKDVSWRKSIETFLGKKRFHIIVEGKYCHTAIQILQEKKIYTANVVITDKLPERELVSRSAAEQLVVPNVYARRYVNYLLNGIHLCESLEELHEHPKGGLTKDGMLAKSYAVSYMNIRKTEVCMGQGIIEIQKKAVQEKQRIAERESQSVVSELEVMRQKEKQLREVDLHLSNYVLDAPDLLADNLTKKEDCKKNIEQIKSNPDFIAVLQEQAAAKRAYEEADNKRTEVVSALAVSKNEIEREKDSLKQNAGNIQIKTNRYEEKRLQHLELEKEMLQDYEKMRERKGEIKVITEKTVTNLRGELDSCVKALETEQLEYCKIAEIDINKRGVGYIPFFREEYRNIANVRIEEAHSRLEEQSKKLESAFMNDFVAEMNETIVEARREIDSINSELRLIPFGQDTYQFKMFEKPDRMLFFRICKKLEDYMNSPELYMNSNREDEEMERDIQEFMDMILQEEDEEEYTDYRKYFTYDMKIISRQGDEKIEADLSKKQGSASNGEKQTPYFIILAASLLQCYPKKNVCARLAFIDEAFSALSRERIEQMVKYLEGNHFQVIYAAPPEKIGSIGEHINSTISLVPTGRYTKVIEGLVKYEELYK